MTVSLKLLSSIGSSMSHEENMVLSGLPANCSNGSGRAIGGRRHTKQAKPAA